MKRGKVLNLSRFRLTEFITKNGLFTGLCFVFLIGIILGSVFWDESAGLKNFSKEYFEKFLNIRIQNQFFGIFLNSFLNSLMSLAVIFIFGSSMFGVILIPLSLLYNGFTYGCLSSFIYANFALKGIAFNAVIILPFSCVLVISLIAFALEGVKFSYSISRLVFPNSISQNLYFTFKPYFIKFICFSFLILLSSLIDSVLSKLFISNFNF